MRGPAIIRGMLPLVVGALLTTTSISCRQGPAPTPLTTGDENLAVDDLRADIELLQTVNRLELTAEQIDNLLQIIGRLEGINRTYDRRQTVDHRDTLEALLAHKREILIKDQPVNEELQAKLEHRQQMVQDLERERAEALQEVIPDLRAVLTDAQMQIVAGVDQAKVQAEEMLAWLRELPEVDYGEEAPANAEALASADVGVDTNVLLDVFHTARDMSAEEYRQAKHELVARIAPIYGATPAAADRLILRLFTNPRTKVILQEKASFIR